MQRTLFSSASAALFLGGLMLGSCGTQRQDTMQDPVDERRTGTGTTAPTADIEIERAETRTELIALRDRIDARISDVDNHLGMAGMEDQRRNELREYRRELEQNRDRVERELRNVETAESSTWTNIRQGTRNTVQDINDWFSRQGERVEGWFQRNDTVPEYDD
jgi:hypothetical protein